MTSPICPSVHSAWQSNPQTQVTFRSMGVCGHLSSLSQSAKSCCGHLFCWSLWWWGALNWSCPKLWDLQNDASCVSQWQMWIQAGSRKIASLWHLKSPELLGGLLLQLANLWVSGSECPELSGGEGTDVSMFFWGPSFCRAAKPTKDAFSTQESACPIFVTLGLFHM